MPAEPTAPRREPLLLRFQNLIRRAGIDHAIGYTLISRGWTVMSGAVSLILLSHFLTKVEQGYYFTFSDVLALQVFFELGLATVLMQYASHEKAHLNWTPEGKLEGDPVAKSRLASLLRFSLIWYGVVAVLALLFVLPAGALFFGKYHIAKETISWQLPWVWIVLVTAGSLAITPLLAVLEGCGLIAQIAGVQMQQNLIGSILFWITLFRGWKLSSAPVTNTVVMAGSMMWLWKRHRHMLSDLLRFHHPNSTIHWRREVLPMQWRTALIWLSSYLVIRSFDPILFATRGPAAAGQMGMSLAVMSAIAAISLAWVTTKAAPFGMLIARRDFVMLDSLFFPCLWQSLGVEMILGALFWTGSLLLRTTHSQLGMRLLPPLPMGLLVGTTIVYHLFYTESIYLRAHKQEPFLGITIITGILVSAGALLMARPFGATGILLAYFTATILLELGVGTLIFIKKRTQWHAPGYLFTTGSASLLELPEQEKV